MHAIITYPLYGFVGGIILTMALHALSIVVPKAEFFARCVGAYLAFVVVCLYGAVASIILRLTGDASSAQWNAGRAFKYAMGLATGVTFTAEDPDHVLDTVRPAVFIGNHQTELDVLMLGCIFPKHCSITAKASLRNAPFLGWFMRASGSIFIDRANSRDAREAMSGAAQQMRDQSQSVYMFPEGTRSYAKEPVLLPFKKGAFHLAVQGQVPIVPIVVANYSHVLWLKGLVFRSGNVPCKVLDPIPTIGLTSADVEDLTRTTRELMLKELIALTARARGEPVPMAVDSNGTAAKATGISST